MPLMTALITVCSLLVDSYLHYSYITSIISPISNCLIQYQHYNNIITFTLVQMQCTCTQCTESIILHEQKVITEVKETRTRGAYIDC